MPLDRPGFIRAVLLQRDKVPDFGRYPYSIPAVSKLDRLELGPAVTFLVGENGSGKSTLVEALAIAAGFNAEGGSSNFNFSTAAAHSELHRSITLERGIHRPSTGFFLRAESFFNVATTVDRLVEESGVGLLDSYGGKSLHERSHGESFLALATNRFGPNGLYILDEPEAALSVRGNLALLSRMRQLVDEGSQFVVATHSPILMAFPGATIYALGEDGYRTVGYEESEQYELTRSFLEDRERFFRYLFES